MGYKQRVYSLLCFYGLSVFVWEHDYIFCERIRVEKSVFSVQIICFSIAPSPVAFCQKCHPKQALRNHPLILKHAAH